MKLFRVYVDGKLFYHPHFSRLAITQAQVKEDAENIDSLIVSAPYNHPYLKDVKPMSSEIVCKKERIRYLKEGRWMMGLIFIIPIHGLVNQHLHI